MPDRRIHRRSYELLERAMGDPVNLEPDIMMRYVAQAVENRRRVANADGTAPTNRRDPLLATNPSLVDLVGAIRALPYGRPSDRSVEGLRMKDRPVFSVQYHPEASPGPRDSQLLYKQFVSLLQH